LFCGESEAARIAGKVRSLPAVARGPAANCCRWQLAGRSYLTVGRDPSAACALVMTPAAPDIDRLRDFRLAREPERDWRRPKGFPDLLPPPFSTAQWLLLSFLLAKDFGP